MAVAAGPRMMGCLSAAAVAPRFRSIDQHKYITNSRRSWHTGSSTTHRPGSQLPDPSPIHFVPAARATVVHNNPLAGEDLSALQPAAQDHHTPGDGAGACFQELGLVDNAVESTLEHRLWTAFGFGTATATIAKAFVQHRPPASAHSSSVYVDIVIVLGAVILGHVLADLVSGVVHWLADNYGDTKTPHFGPSIDAAQGHHKRPWVITTRHFANNVHVVTRTGGLALLLPILLLPRHLFFHSLLGSFAVFGMLSQQCHAWAHMQNSRVPFSVAALQRAGLLLSAKAHAPHHKAPHESCYCLVSGMWNDILKHTDFFLRVERAVYAIWGVTPRSWAAAPEHQSSPP